MLPNEGKYFLLVNNDCNLSVGIKNKSDDPDEPVVLCNQNDKEEHQIWYEDAATNTIRSMANAYCLTFSDGDRFVTVSEFRPMSESQEWTIGDGYVVHRKDRSKVLDAKVPLQCGSKLCGAKSSGGGKWKAVYLKPKLFYIVSQLNKAVLEVYQGNPEAGTELMTFDKNPEKAIHQLWYEDKNGDIRSALNNFVFDASEPGKITLQPMDEGNDDHHWIQYGHVVCARSDHNRVLDILNSSTEVPARVGVWEYNGQKNQFWWWHFID